MHQARLGEDDKVVYERFRHHKSGMVPVFGSLLFRDNSFSSKIIFQGSKLFGPKVCGLVSFGCIICLKSIT